MKHKFHGEQCVYCDADASTADHAVGRKFFLEERRGNLPQVPACLPCNNRKSQLESYLMTVLPFGAKNTDAREILEKLVPPRLAKNAKLQRKLERGFAKSGGTSIPFDHHQLTRLFSMVARALLWQHWGVRLENGNSSNAAIFSDEAEFFFERMLAKGPERVSGNLGEGTFAYEGARIDEQTSLWRFSFYGGVDFGGDPSVQRASLAIAVTGRAELIQNLRYADFKKDRTAQKVGRNHPCPCGSTKKHKKCHGDPGFDQRAGSMRSGKG